MMQPGVQQLRQLVLVVESTAALGSQWSVLYKEYIEKVVRAFYGQDVNGQKLQVPVGETGLILFNSHLANQTGLLQEVGWTSNVDVCLQWLSNIPFTGGGFGDVAMAEGLAKALIMCSPPATVANGSQGVERQKHVVLVATSSPCIIPKPVCTPPAHLNPDGNPTDQEMRQWCLAETEDVAKWFPLCHVSLSVICPRRLPQLRNIYNLARRNPASTAPEVITAKQYPYHTVFLSGDFFEARAVLGHNVHSNSQPMVTNVPKVEPHDLPTATTGVSGSHGVISAGTLAQGKPKMEGLTGMITNSKLPPVPSASLLSSTSAASVPVQHSATSVPVQHSAIQSAQDSLHPIADSGVPITVKQELTHSDAPSVPLGSNAGMLATHSQGYHGVALQRVVNNNALQVADGNFSGVSTILSSQGTGVHSFPGGTAGQGTMGLGQGLLGVGGLQVDTGAQGNVGNGLTGFSMQPISATMVTRAQGTSVSHASVPGSQLTGSLGQLRGLGAGSQIGQPVSRSVLSGLPLTGGVASGTVHPNRATAQAGVVSGNRLTGVSGHAPLIGTSLQQQQQQLQQTTQQALQQPIQQSFQSLQQPIQQNLQPPQQSLQGPAQQTLQSSLQQPIQQNVQQPVQQGSDSTAPKYQKLWDGLLAGLRGGKPVAICKLECFRQSTSPETLATDWPQTMQIMRLIEQDYMNSKELQGKAEVLVFRPLNPHAFLGQLAEKKLCAVIQLPSQTLLLASASVEKRMIGMLFPGDMVIMKPQNSTPQQQSQQTQQQQAEAPTRSYGGSSIV